MQAGTAHSACMKVSHQFSKCPLLRMTEYKTMAAISKLNAASIKYYKTGMK
jgi:hypothetical protein